MTKNGQKRLKELQADFQVRNLGIFADSIENFLTVLELDQLNYYRIKQLENTLWEAHEHGLITDTEIMDLLSVQLKIA